MPNYQRGNAANIVVGAAALFVSNIDSQLLSSTRAGVTAPGSGAPNFVEGVSYKDVVSNTTGWTSLGYTSNGLELTFNPTFGEVAVDQLLDVARLFKSGMTVSMRTTLAEATLENLLLVLAQRGTVNRYGNFVSGQTTAATTISYTTAANTESTVAHGSYIDLMSGDLGDYPVERSLIAVGPSTMTSAALDNSSLPTGATTSDQRERVYLAYRVVNISNVTISAKRDTATMFDVEFRLLPDANGAYGKLVDRTY